MTSNQATTLPQTHAQPDPDNRPRSAIAGWSVRHRWLVLTSALLIFGAAIYALGFGIKLAAADDALVGDSAAATHIVDRSGLGGANFETVAVTAKHDLTKQEVGTIGHQLARTYEGVKGIKGVSPAFPGADGVSAVVRVELTGDDVDIAPMLAATESYRSAHPGLTVGQIGTQSITKQFNDTVGHDFQRAEFTAVPVTLIVLLIAFGAVVAAGVPLLLGIGSVVVALGLSVVASHTWTPYDGNAQSLVLLIGLAVGVDYALFILRRTREERAAGASKEDSIALAGATAGRAVVVSGLTVIVAMSGMLIAGGLFRTLALGTMLVVGVAVLASVTVLPAVLAVLGDKVDALRLPWRRRKVVDPATSRWGRLAGAVASRPVLWGGLTVALLIALASPALGMRTALSGPESLPQDLPVVKAYHQVAQAAPSEGNHLQIVVKAPAGAHRQVADAVLGMAPEAAKVQGVNGTAANVETSKDSTVTTWGIGVSYDLSDRRFPGVVDEVRTAVVPALEHQLAGVPGVEVHVGGDATSADMSTWMTQRLWYVVPFVLALTLLVMAVSFGSWWLAGATVLLNLISVGAAYGVMVLVFQGTWAEGLLNFTSTDAIAAWLPLLMFVVLFGLSMDYHVFVTSRVREARERGLSPVDAIQVGVARSAGVVTSAAAVMVAVFAIFGTLSALEMKQMGVGLAVAVLLDATVVRGVLLPATLGLLGDRAHRGPRWLPHLRH